MSLRTALQGCMVAVLVALPRLASACSVCSAGRDEESQWAFILTTIFLSVLPLLMLGAIGWSLWRRLRAAEERREAAEAGSLDAVPGH